MKKNLMVILTGNHFIRNYISTNAFSDIENEYHCSYLVSDRVSSFQSFGEKRDIFQYHLNKEIETEHYHLFNVMMWRFRNKSSSFKFRILRGFKLHSRFPSHYGLLKKAIALMWRIALNIYSIFLLTSAGNKIIFPFYFGWKKWKLKINPDIYNVIVEHYPSLVLMPSAAYDPEGNDAVRVCKKLNIPILFLIDNWDNLSSKSILWAKPSHVGVWGEQSVEHAVNIQGFEKEQVTCLGTPRFDQYFQVRDIDLKSNFDFKYILFVGTTLVFDEADVLLQLNEIISRNADIFSGVKIVYRPHPWGQMDDSILGKNLEHVIIDPQLLTAYSNRGSSDDVQPELSYYPSLLKNAEFVVGGLTSMLIETLIFRRRFMALVHDDGKNFTSQHNAFKYYTHFQGLRSVDAMAFCESIDTLENVFIDTWKTRNNVDIEKVDSQRRYFYFDDSRSYGQRLLDLCCEITNGATTADVTPLTSPTA